MAMVAVKKVRMTEHEVALLGRLAMERNTTESEILREGLKLVDRVERRQRCMTNLIDMAELVPQDDSWKATLGKW